MKLKKIILSMAMAAAVVPSFAQYEGLDLTNPDVRYRAFYKGEDEDPVLAVKQNVSMLQMGFQSQDWNEMYINYKWLLEHCPVATVNIYARGNIMYQNLIKNTEDPAQKKKYLDELMEMFDIRIKYLDYLNASIPEGKPGRAGVGDVLLTKANTYHVCGYGVDPNYTYNTIYDMYAKGIKNVRESGGGREVKGLYIQYFFSTSNELYKVSKDYYGEQYINDYQSCVEVCDKMLQLAKEESDPDKAMAIVDEYDKPKSVIEQVFAQSGAANRETLLAVFTPKVEQNKTNADYLDNVLVLLNDSCSDTDLYYQAANYAYDIRPSYLNAIGTAQYYSKQKNNAEAMARYQKALELCQTDLTRATISRKIADAMISTGNFAGATEYLNKAVQYNPDQQGRAYFSMANMAVKQHKFADAIDYYNKASQADITLTGASERMIANVKSVQQRIAAAEAQQKAYNDAVAKQKAEDDFWKGGK